MSTKLRALLVSALSLVAFTAIASNASAATSVIIPRTQAYTATTTALQAMRTTVSGLIPVTINCTQSATFGLNAGTYSGTSTVGSLSSVGFTCLNTSLGTPTIATLGTPWPIAGTAANFTATNGLVTVQNVQIQVTLGSVRCLFTGAIGMGVVNGSSAGTLLLTTLTASSGPCSNGNVTGTGYTLSPAPSWTIS